MKKSTFYVATLATLFATQSSAMNAATQVPVTGSSTGITEMTVEFETSNEAVKPLNPKNPTETATNASGTVTPGQTAGLSLDYVPAKLAFGHQKLVMGKQSINVQDDAFVQMTDQRGANGLGWNLSVKTSKAFKINDSEIKDAKLTFEKPQTQNNLTGNVWTKTELGQKATISLTPDEDSAVVAVAKVGEGLGTNQAIWTKNQINMDLDGSTISAGAYVGELTWTLSAAAQQ